MSFLRKLFGKKAPEKHTSPEVRQPSRVDAADVPDKIKVYDGYGREIFITRQQWRDVLVDNLEKMRSNPDQLYTILADALQNGFAADVIPYAEHLWRTDLTSRGAIILGIVYMEVNRLDDAQRVLEDYITSHGEDGIVLTNLAKIHDRHGDDARAESILWHALELDPNQDNGLYWYVGIQGQRGGEESLNDAFRRVAALPNSWRAQLFLARDALQHKDVAAAKILYTEALARAGQPVLPELLAQMSGDLGNNGYLDEIIRLVEPHFDPAIHGLQVGNNLIKTHYDLGQLDEARRILSQLYAQKRPDWQEGLHYWDTELAKAGVTKRAQTPPEELSISLLPIEGPLWAHAGSPFYALLPAKRADALQIAVFGSTALQVTEPGEATYQPQLSDGPGQLSRAIPLFFAEQIHLTTDAAGIALIPWIQNQGFAFFGCPHEDRNLCATKNIGSKTSDFVVGVTLDTTRPQWQLALRLLRIADGQRIAEAQVDVDSNNPGPSVELLAEKLIKVLVEQARITTTPAPDWYLIPAGNSIDYLIRLEQQLAVACAQFGYGTGGGLSGEHGILDSVLQLCLHQPTNQLVRMIFVQTLRHMQKARPEILLEYKEKIDLLQRSHPLMGEVGQRVTQAIAEIYQKRDV